MTLDSRYIDYLMDIFNLDIDCGDLGDPNSPTSGDSEFDIDGGAL